MAPAWSRLAITRNAPGATMKLRKASLPSQMLSARNSRVRRMFMDRRRPGGCATCLFYRAAQCTLRGGVGDRVRDQINGCEDERNHAPRTEEKILGLEVPELFVDTGLAHLRFEPARLAQNQHSNISFEFDASGLTHASTELAAADGICVIERSGTHGASIRGLKWSKVEQS